MTKEEMAEAIERGNLQKIEAIVQDGWNSPPDLLRLCDVLGALNNTLKQLVRHKRRAITQMVSRIREKTARMDPDMLIAVARWYWIMTSDAIPAERQISNNAPVFLGTNPDECPQAVALFSIFNRARLRLWGGLIARESEAQEAFLGLHLMFGSLIVTAAKTNTWNNLIRATFAGDKQARRAFEIICVFPHFFGDRHIAFTPLSQWNASAKPYENINPQEVLSYLFATKHKAQRTIWLPVPDGMESAAYALEQELLTAYDRDNARLVSFLAWFNEHADFFTARKQTLWQEIATAPRYALRPHGLDSISLAVDPINTPAASYRAMRFFPQNPFPAIRTDWECRSFGEATKISITLTHPSSYTERLASQGSQDHSNQVLQSVLEYIIVSAYWRIVSGKQPGPIALPQFLQSASADAERVLRSSRQTAGLAIIRPRFRHLPEGSQASLDAIDRALAHPQFGYAPPDGMTFVREHTRGLGALVDSKPLFTFTHTDMGYDLLG